MSPILVRPVREQLEHDRVIRLLQAKYKRKFDVAINPGNEQAAPVGGPPPWYPDLVLQSGEKNRKLLGVVEVETTESVNHLEAMSQWSAFARMRVPFHLYVPVGCVESARRLCSDLQIPAAEMWAYQAVGDQMRFTLVDKSPQAGDGRRAAAPSVAQSAARPAAAKPAATRPAAARSATPKSATPKSANKSTPKPVKSASSKPAPPAPATAKPAAARAAAPRKGEGAEPSRPASRTSATAARRKTAAPAKAKAAAPRRAAAKAAHKTPSRPAGQKRR